MNINVGAVLALLMFECFIALISWIAHTSITNDRIRRIVLTGMAAGAGGLVGAGFGIWLVTV